MAEATITTESIKKTITVDEERVHLSLNREEASILTSLLSQVQLDNSPGGVSYQIYKALKNSGVSASNYKTRSDVYGNIIVSRLGEK